MQTFQQLIDYQLTTSPLKIEEIRVLNGANFFSGEQIIRFRLNLGKYDEVFSNQIPNFYENLKTILPSLHEHHCSIGKKGGFFTRVKNGTLLGHVMEHVAIELQNLAGLEVGFGKTRETKKKATYNVIFRYQDEYAGIYAGKVALNLLNYILNNLTPEIAEECQKPKAKSQEPKVNANLELALQKDIDIEQIIKNLIFIRERRLLGPSTQAIVNEAKRRNISVQRLNSFNQIQLGTGKYRKHIRATITDNTSLIAVEKADDKYLTTSILQEKGIPVPETIITEELQDILDFHNKIKKPIVLKPAYGNRGKGLSIDLNDETAITNAFNWVIEHDEEVIAQKDILGGTYRLLIIDFKFVAAVRLIPAYINGDGKSSIKQLIDVLNSETHREVGDKGKLTKLKIDNDTLKILELKNYTLETILPETEILYLKNSGNMRLGASSIDVTDTVHKKTKLMAERISRILNLNVAGIDILSQNIKLPLNENAGRVIEVNAAPDFRMHIYPTVGTSRYVQRNFLSMVFPKNCKTEIPILSITGSKGKSLCSEIIHKAFKSKGLVNGRINKTGFYIDENKIFAEDIFLDSKYVNILLQESVIDTAIIETPVEAILDTGLGYKLADFGIILNLFNDKSEYLDYDHIRSIKDIAYAKSVVAEQVKDEGYSILNVDYDLISEMKNRVYSNIVLFSKNHNNPVLKRHVRNDGIAVAVKNTQIIIYDNNIELSVVRTNEIKIIDDLNKNFNLDCILASITVLYLSDFEINEIRDLLT